MSIFSQLVKKQITFSQAVTQTAAWATKTVTSDPVLLAAEGQAVSVLKQRASDALGLADTAIGVHLGEAVSAVENAADTFLLKITGGVASPDVPVVNAGIENSANILKAAIDAKVMEWKAKLTPTVATSATPPQAGA